MVFYSYLIKSMLKTQSQALPKENPSKNDAIHLKDHVEPPEQSSSNCHC